MKVYTTLALILLSLVSYSQSVLINTSRWDSPVAFENSSTPTIKAFGEHSDSLKAIYGVQFLYHNGNYFHLTTWADYYLWFTQKYSYLFYLSPELYQNYYESGNNYAMMDYVFNFYRGDILPTIKVDLGTGGSRDIRSYAFNANRFRNFDNELARERNLMFLARTSPERTNSRQFDRSKVTNPRRGSSSSSSGSSSGSSGGISSNSSGSSASISGKN
ncbi:hypothetical protein [Ekhidna sp.]